ncbi:Aldo/keto reductase [Naematelia encephala]|uniref:Aldo/keto reductase n=1 Tax=Naematelia encephala TaxID=71784 RepID=A0A1Y2B6T8_9TREE|nr:Aldo/keto reductase [Naematelia encephala]
MRIPQVLLALLSASSQMTIKPTPYPNHQLFKLNDGNSFPSPAFGCGSALFGKEATDSVLLAIENGYLHIDNSRIYGNEKSVGAALSQTEVDRRKLYITSKYDGINGASVEEEFNQTISELGVDYLDLYLIHFPGAADKGGGIEKVWRSFEKLKREGKAKSIGVSNYDHDQLEELLALAEIKPAVNQIRYHAYNALESASTLAISQENGILTEAYSSLTPITKTPGGPADAIGASIAEELSERYGKEVTVGQTILDWLRSTGVAAVT